MTHPALSVNLNKVALLRNTRDRNLPNVLEAARTVLAAGAQGLTVHPRPDRRHILPDDVRGLRTLLHRFAAIELNIEGNPFAERRAGYPGTMELIRQARPEQATLVPDEDGQSTSDHGFSAADVERLTPVVAELQALGCRVSLFVDPDPEPLEALQKTGADRVEIYTGPYAAAESSAGRAAALAACVSTASRARELGFGVNAGHDLDLTNLPDLARAIPHLAEVSIGHALTADALQLGWTETVRRYLVAVGRAEA